MPPSAPRPASLGSGKGCLRSALLFWWVSSLKHDLILGLRWSRGTGCLQPCVLGSPHGAPHPASYSRPTMGREGTLPPAPSRFPFLLKGTYRRKKPKKGGNKPLHQSAAQAGVSQKERGGVWGRPAALPSCCPRPAAPRLRLGQGLFQPPSQAPHKPFSHFLPTPSLWEVRQAQLCSSRAWDVRPSPNLSGLPFLHKRRPQCTSDSLLPPASHDGFPLPQESRCLLSADPSSSLLSVLAVLASAPSVLRQGAPPSSSLNPPSGLDPWQHWPLRCAQ